jgi:hypothetical protein
MTAEALDSAEAGERVQDTRNAWGKTIARQLAAACRLLRRTGLGGLNPCRTAKAEWEQRPAGRVVSSSRPKVVASQSPDRPTVHQ